MKYHKQSNDIKVNISIFIDNKKLEVCDKNCVCFGVRFTLVTKFLITSVTSGNPSKIRSLHSLNGQSSKYESVAALERPAPQSHSFSTDS
jgi:hypothetical protein